MTGLTSSLATTALLIMPEVDLSSVLYAGHGEVTAWTGGDGHLAVPPSREAYYQFAANNDGV